MSRFNSFQAVVLSLFSRELYRDVLKNWQGLGVIYLLILIGVSALPAALKMSSSINNTLGIKEEKVDYGNGKYLLSEKMIYIAEQVPEIVIDNGVMSSDVDEPHTINSMNDEKPLIIIDSDNKANYLKETDAFALLTQHYMFLKLSRDIVGLSWPQIMENIGIPTTQKLVINKKVILEWMNEGAEQTSILSSTFYFLILISKALFFLIRALVFTLGGILICQILKIEIPLLGIMRLSVVSSTPIIIFEMLSLYVGEHIFAHRDIIYFITQIWYLYFAIESNKKVTPDGL